MEVSVGEAAAKRGEEVGVVGVVRARAALPSLPSLDSGCIRVSAYPVNTLLGSREAR